MDEEIKKLLQAIDSNELMNFIKTIKSEDHEIMEFIKVINARSLQYNDVLYGIAKKPNYFILNDSFLIVKRSQGKKPWWGVGKKYIDILNEWGGKYFLVLLISGKEGWVYSNNEIKNNVIDGYWKLREEDQNYKIYPAVVKDANSFISHKQFLKKIGIETI